MSWWYEKEGQQAGPVSESELMALYDRETIRDATLIWQSGMGEWVPFAKAWPAKSAARFQAQTTQERPRPIWGGVPDDARLSLPLALTAAFAFMKTRDAILIALNGLLMYILFVVITGFLPYYLGVILLQSAALGVWLSFIIDRLRGEPIGELLKGASHRQLLPLLFHSLAVSGVLILAIVIAGGMTFLAAQEGGFSPLDIENFTVPGWAGEYPFAAAAILLPWAVMLWGWGMSLPLIMDRHLSFSAAIATSMQLATRFLRPIGGLVLLAAVLTGGFWLLSRVLWSWVEADDHKSLLGLALSLAFLYLALWMVVAYLHLYLQLFPLTAKRKAVLSDPFASLPGREEKH